MGVSLSNANRGIESAARAAAGSCLGALNEGLGCNHALLQDTMTLQPSRFLYVTADDIDLSSLSIRRKALTRCARAVPTSAKRHYFDDREGAREEKEPELHHVVFLRNSFRCTAC